MRFIWMPIAKVQEGLGGKTRAIIAGVTAAVALIAVMLVFVPYPLKMDSKGSLLPKDRGFIYSPVDAKIEEFKVEPNQEVRRGEVIAQMSSNDLKQKMMSLMGERDAAQGKFQMSASQMPKARDQEKNDLAGRIIEAEITRKNKEAELRAFIEAVHGVPGEPGKFNLISPSRGPF